MRLSALLAFALAALPAAADELVLRNGSVLHGSVHEEGDRVVVRMDVGTMSFKKVDVREIRRTGDALKEFEAKSAAATTAKDCVDVAVWAKDRGLQNRANEMYEKALLLEPDHEVARRALGWEKHEGRWLKGDDLMVARGFVKHNGAWIHAELLDRELARQAEERMQNERVKAAERQSARDFEVEMQRVEIERQRVENEKRWRYDSWSCSTWGWPMGCGTGVVLPSSVLRPGVPALQLRPRTLPPAGSSLVPAVQPFHIVPPR
jgi:hypothetical protein